MGRGDEWRGQHREKEGKWTLGSRAHPAWKEATFCLLAGLRFLPGRTGLIENEETIDY